MSGVVVPAGAVGLRLCKVVRERLVLCEAVMFQRGSDGVGVVLRRAKLAGSVGPLGETGDYWADVLNAEGDWFDTIALSREAWNSLKNRWMRCQVQP